MQETITEQELDLMSAHLFHAYKKSGVSLDASFLLETVHLIPDADKSSSAFLGFYEIPREDHKKGRIILYTDAIKNYAQYIGRSQYDVATKILFCLIYDYINFMNKQKTGDAQKAEKFATKACRKLLRQGIITQMPPIFYFDYNDKNMYYQIILRKQWMEKWTDMNIEELSKEVFGQ